MQMVCEIDRFYGTDSLHFLSLAENERDRLEPNGGF